MAVRKFIPLILGLLLVGCQKSQPAQEPAPDTQPATASASAEGAQAKSADDELAVPVTAMVTTAPVQHEAYTENDKLPTGTLKGMCFVKAELGAQPPADAIDFTNPAAIKDPAAGELDYFKNLRIAKPTGWYFNPSNRPLGKGEHGINGAVVMVTDVQGGPRVQLTRTGFTSVKGQITCQYVGGYGLSSVGFCPPGERVLFGTSESYPCFFEMTQQATGKVIFSGGTPGYNDPNLQPGERVDPRAFRPKLLQSQGLEQPGLYVIACKRHPWQKAHLWVVPNPYVTETYSRGGERIGIFQIDGVPAGRHTIEVWHPVYQPVSKTFEVTIRPDAVTEVPVEFVLPKE
jgi:hypothetical protein